MLRDLLNSFSVGITLDWAQAAWFDGVMLSLFVLGIAIPNSQFRIANCKFRIALSAYLFLPILGVLILSLARPLYQNSRYLIAISPAFYLGVAAGIAALARWRRPLALAALGVFVIGAALSLNNWYFDPRFGKDDHRAWAESLRERAHTGDFLILNSPHTEELYRYYADDIVPMTTLPILRADGKPSPDADRAAVRDAYRNNARVWYLAMDVPFDDPDARVEKYSESGRRSARSSAIRRNKHRNRAGVVCACAAACERIRHRTSTRPRVRRTFAFARRTTRQCPSRRARAASSNCIGRLTSQSAKITRFRCD